MPKQRHPWVRFEAVHAAALILFFVAGIAGLVALWIGLAFAPAAVVAVAPEVAIQIVIGEAMLITGAIGMSIAARNLVVREWLRIAPTASSAQMKALHGWITGPSLIAAWASVLIPAYASALLAMSSFASLIVVGMLYASVRSLIQGHAALLEYMRARRTADGEPKGAFGWMALGAACIALGLISAAIVHLVPIVTEARAAIVAPIDRQLSVLSMQIDASRDDLVFAQKLYAERIQSDTDALEREIANFKKGIGSQQEVYLARQRLLAIQTEAFRVGSEAQQTMSRYEREKADLQRQKARAQSAAPALSH